jgi:hypothetical protein
MRQLIRRGGSARQGLARWGKREAERHRPMGRDTGRDTMFYREKPANRPRATRLSSSQTTPLRLD